MNENRHCENVIQYSRLLEAVKYQLDAVPVRIPRVLISDVGKTFTQAQCISE